MDQSRDSLLVPSTGHNIILHEIACEYLYVYK